MRLAGPLAADRATLNAVFTQRPLLPSIVAQAKHAVLRQRAADVIDRLVREMPDPQMTVHWAAITHPLHATCRIFITSAGYDLVYRTPAVLHVETDSMTLLGRDSRALRVTHQAQHLQDVLVTLMCQHHTHVVQSFAKILHWHPVSGNLNLGAGAMDPRGHVSSAILASPCSTALVAVRVDSLHGPRVYVKRTIPSGKPAATQTSMSTEKHSAATLRQPGQLLPSATGATVMVVDDDDDDDMDWASRNRLFDPDWTALTQEYEQVDWRQIEGQNFMSKMEMLLGCLTKSNFSSPVTSTGLAATQPLTSEKMA